MIIILFLIIINQSRAEDYYDSSEGTKLDKVISEFSLLNSQNFGHHVLKGISVLSINA